MTTKENIQRILDLPTKFFVDIGASNDPNESQTELLLENGWSGVMFECNPDKYVGLMKRMEGKSVHVISDKVTPDNILEHLQSANVPQDFFLSLDIDGYDYFVLKTILSKYKPQYIVSEINEKIPPPIRFTVLYDPSYWWGGNHFYGYSISMLEELLPEYGYMIEELHYNNVILVPGTQEKTIEDIYNDGYFARPDGWNRFSYNADFDPIYTMTPDQQLKFLHQKFSNYEGQYMVNEKIDIENTGQIQLTQPFGQWISKYAADQRVTRYTEIGTWNGRGSTCCFYDGFLRRDTPARLQSYETSESRAKEAASLWSRVPKIQVVRGRVLEDSECPPFSIVKSVHPNLSVQWHAEDIHNFWACPHVPMNDPEVVLLDGAESVTYFEVEKMKKMTGIRVFLLDDALIDKCRAISSYLLQHPEWTRVAYSDTERNGWAVFERTTSYTAQST